MVVAKADIHIVAGQKFQTEHKVTHEVGAETLFLHQVAVGVVLVLWFVVRQAPFAQVVGGDGEAEWRCAKPLRIAQLNIPWQAVFGIGGAVELLHLATKVFRHHREREFVVGVVDVHTQVGGDGSSREIAIF